MLEFTFLGKRVIVYPYRKKETQAGVQLLQDQMQQSGNYVLGRVDAVGLEVDQDVISPGCEVMFLEHVGTNIQFAPGNLHRVLMVEDICCVIRKGEGK